MKILKLVLIVVIVLIIVGAVMFMQTITSQLNSKDMPPVSKNVYRLNT